MKYPDIEHIISLSEKAAKCIVAIYREPSFAVSIKSDKSLLTLADTESHAIICEDLAQYYPDIPVISEESTEFYSHDARQAWEYFFLVDPLDGTKEFVNRNDEFTINIALIHKDRPVMGVINAPALGVIYYAEQGKGAFKITKNKKIKLPFMSPKKEETVTVAVSRSHFCQQTERFLEDLKNQRKNVSTISAGSALKFGLVAEGRADMYPRFTPTMEWDTAAGQVLVNEVGKRVWVMGWDDELRYNKKDLRNSGFLVG